MYKSEETEVLFSPWVMRSAWNKVLSWYSTGEWYDPAELLEWKADPWRYLADLASDLSKGTYKPGPFPEIPYPKKGGYTRHFVMPSVRDQVAFMVFMVLLGPFLEARMPNVSMGNRLYRPRVRKAPNRQMKISIVSAGHDVTGSNLAEGHESISDSPNLHEFRTSGMQDTQNTEDMNRNDTRKCWYQAPFSLSHKRVYTGFAASYGLFRRVLQWLANHYVLGKDWSDTDIEDPETEDPDLLPYGEYLKRQTQSADLAYAKLDLKMTFPSLSRRKLRKVMHALVKDRVEPSICPESRCKTQAYIGYGRPKFPTLVSSKSEGFQNWIEPYRELSVSHPWKYLTEKENARLRKKLVKHLMNMLESVTYLPWEVPNGWRDSVNSWFPCNECCRVENCAEKLSNENRKWVGPHGFAPLPSEKSECGFASILDREMGLPTGLAISGFLLNVALTPVDECMVALADSINKSSGCLFYLRFVDDVVILAKEPGDLENAIHEFQAALRRFAGDTLRLNISKVKPEGVKNYLLPSAESTGAQHIEPTGDSEQTKDPASIAKTDCQSLQSHLRYGDYLTRENLELFTTEIVREMSGMVDETLGERFGAHGIERLEQLMELATLEIDDFEVGADARLSFAVNRLARASWPRGPVLREDRVLEAKTYIKRIMLIAETALRRHPWRFKLWRAILIIALRVSLRINDGSSKDDPGLAWLCKKVLPIIKWLPKKEECRSLSDIRWETFGVVDDSCAVEQQVWQKDVGSIDDNCTGSDFDCRKDALSTAQTHRCRERTSFHRAQFWRQWTYCMQTLQRIAEINDEFPSRGWLAFFTAEDARLVLRRFGNIRTFAKALYGDWTWRWEEKPFLWWWEAEALNVAALTVLSVNDLGDIDSGGAASVLEDDYSGVHEPNPNGIKLAESVLDSLGPPCAEVLRKAVEPGSIQSDVLASQFSEVSKVQDQIRRVFKRVISYDNLNKIVSKPPRLPDSAKAVWLVSYFGCWHSSVTTRPGHSKQELAQKVVPGPNDSEWALLGRLSYWDSLYPRLKPVSTKAFPVPKVQKGLDDPWPHFIILQDYATLRRLLTAHDLQVPLRLFQGWFPHLSMYMSCDRKADSERTLHHALYNLGNQPGCFPRPSRVPEIGVQWYLAWKICDGLAHHKDSDKIVTPSTVILKGSAFEDLVKFRKTEIVNSNKRKFQEVCWDDSPVEGLISLTPDHPAPHPLFIVLPYFPGSNDYCPQVGALLLWLLEGSEWLLDQIFQFFPWHLPLVEREHIKARLLIPKFIWYKIERLFGMPSAVFFTQQGLTNEGESTDLQQFEDKIESELDELLLHDPWVRNIVFDVEGKWDLKTLPSKSPQSKQPSDYAAKLNLRLIQGVETPVYSKWLPSAMRPFFSVNRDSMERVWEEMAAKIQEAYDEARISVGSGADQTRDDLVVFPECYADRGSVRDFREFCFQTGIGVLCGLLPRELPRAVPVVRQVRTKGLRCLVNEAVLVLPSYEREKKKKPTNKRSSPKLPSKVYQFYIRKSIPSVIENSLVKALDEMSKTNASSVSSRNDRWYFVSGNSWPCFHYPRWGGLTVALCSDVLTTGNWRELYDYIEHLFILACNQDIDLFEQVTWARGYELYVNSVTVNHGVFGGTTVWTPKRSYHKEVFRVRGPEKGLAIVVSVPVKSLVEARRNQYDRIRGKKPEDWFQKMGVPFVRESEMDSGKKEFKTPPPQVTYKHSKNQKYK